MSTNSSDNTLDSFIREWDAKLVAYIRYRVPTAALAAEIAQEVWFVIYQREDVDNGPQTSRGHRSKYPPGS